MRNPYARSLRTKPQQVIADKRDKAIREIWDATADEEIPDRFKQLLNDLD